MVDTVFSKSVTITASPGKVWQCLTTPGLMKQWMMPETEIEIKTDWKEGGPFTIEGDWYKSRFINYGTVLEFEPEKVLSYSHLSSLSRLPNVPENHSILKMELVPDGESTVLTVSAANFPTEAIYKHLAFYWNVTIELLKKFIENQP